MAERVGAGREAEILAWGDGRVLRLLRDPGARDRLEQERLAMAAAKQAGVPVPAVYEVVVVDGRPGLVMERVDGADLLTALSRRPWRLAGAARRLGRLQADLHDNAVAPPELRELRVLLSDQIDVALHLTARTRTYVCELLADLPDGDRICHGDFHPGNVIFGPSGPVVIDWTNATRGDPTGDFARTVLLLRIGAMPAGMSAILRYGDRLGRGMFRRLWVRAYRRARAVDAALAWRWETVWAAARLGEGIDEEVPTLIKLLDRRAQASP